MHSEQVLAVSNLRKVYPNGFLAVDDVSLTLNEGEIFGLLGPNGSGKTTTILMLLGLLEPTAGSVDILGYNPFRTPLQVKRQVAYMPDTVGFYETMTAFENLDYTARFLGLDAKERKSRIVDALARMRLDAKMHDKVRTYSHGMKQRLGLAEVLVKKPRIAILDEPTQGLDPESVAEFLQLIASLRENEQMTVLLSSHQLNEVQSVCDRVGLFSKGMLIRSGSVASLSERQFGENKDIVVELSDATDLASVCADIEGIDTCTRTTGNTWLLICKTDVREQVAQAVFASNSNLLSLGERHHSLDDIYKACFQEVEHETA